MTIPNHCPIVRQAFRELRIKHSKILVNGIGVGKVETPSRRTRGKHEEGHDITIVCVERLHMQLAVRLEPMSASLTISRA